MRIRTFILILLAFFIFQKRSLAQEKDFGIWTTINVEKELSNKLKAAMEEEFRFAENASYLDSYFTDFSLEYKLSKPLSVSLNYRFINKRLEDGYYSKRHRVYGSLSYRFIKHKKFSATFRTQLQYQFGNEWYEATANLFWMWRNKIALHYALKDFKPYASVEMFYPLDYYTGNEIKNWRYVFGCDYNLNKKNKIGLYYLINQEVNLKNPVTTFVVGAEYGFAF